MIDFDSGKAPPSFDGRHACRPVPHDYDQDDGFLVNVSNYPAVATMADASGRGANGATVVDDPKRFKYLAGNAYDAVAFCHARGELIAPRVSNDLSSILFNRHPFEPDSNTSAPVPYKNNAWVKMRWRQESGDRNQMKTIILTQSHIHRGQPYQAGAAIEVSEADADFIVKVGAGVVQTPRHSSEHSDVAIQAAPPPKPRGKRKIKEQSNG